MPLSDTVRAFLDSPRFGVLGTVQADGTPHLTVMWYMLEDDEIMMNTSADRVKAVNLRRDPRVALCIEDAHRYVTIYGSVRLIDDQATAQADVYRLALHYTNPTAAERMVREQFSQQQRLTLRMQIERVVNHL